MSQNNTSFHALYIDGIDFGFDSGSILVYKNDVILFKSNHCHEIYKTSISIRRNNSSIFKLIQINPKIVYCNVNNVYAY